MSFGTYISEARKKAGLSQKDLAARIKKEDGSPISAQYLNDIEHNRRNPPPDFLIVQMAAELELSLEYLLFLAGQFPKDIQEMTPSDPQKVEEAFKAFRRAMGNKK